MPARPGQRSARVSGGQVFREPQCQSEGRGQERAGRHGKGQNGGARQGAHDVVMEDGSFHMAATSRNLALMRY